MGFVMYYVYGAFGPSLLIESTDSIISDIDNKSTMYFLHHNVGIGIGKDTYRRSEICPSYGT